MAGFDFLWAGCEPLSIPSSGTNAPNRGGPSSLGVLTVWTIPFVVLKPTFDPTALLLPPLMDYPFFVAGLDCDSDFARTSTNQESESAAARATTLPAIIAGGAAEAHLPHTHGTVGSPIAGGPAGRFFLALRVSHGTFAILGSTRLATAGFCRSRFQQGLRRVRQHARHATQVDAVVLERTAKAEKGSDPFTALTPLLPFQRKQPVDNGCQRVAVSGRYWTRTSDP